MGPLKHLLERRQLHGGKGGSVASRLFLASFNILICVGETEGDEVERSIIFIIFNMYCAFVVPWASLVILEKLSFIPL